MMIGTSMGGARPKAVVEDEDGLWIAKFNRPDDTWNSARVEHAMLERRVAWASERATEREVTVQHPRWPRTLGLPPHQADPDR